MKLLVTLDGPAHHDVQWPADVPVPVPGDHISMQVDGETLSCEVSSRAFEIGVDPLTGDSMTILRIKGARSLAQA